MKAEIVGASHDGGAKENRKDIQALRGLAILLVVLHHTKHGFLSAGYLGVDIFFVISGYLITRVIRKDVDVIRFDDVLCSKNSCVTEMDGVFIYRDAGHFSYDGSRLVAKRMNLEERLMSVAR